MSMKKMISAAAIVLGVAGVAAMAVAQVTLPQVPSVGNNDLIQVIPNGFPSTGNKYVSAVNLAGYSASLPWQSNLLIGGDASTNLFQRGTSGASVTTTTTFGGPDRWFYWSGTNTAMTVSRDTTAADLATGYQAAFKMARTSGQTGVVQVCMGQAVESVNALQMQGQQVELDFHATAGANFSAASSQMQAYIISGTVADEGAASMAKGLNNGGGGSAGWTGQANATAGLVTISSTSGRYMVTGAIPAGALEVGVALCWTPVGTASTNDYIALSGIQLVRNPALATINGVAASTTAGYTCGTTAVCTSFDRTRGPGAEALLQYRYYYQLNDPAATAQVGVCQVITADTAAVCLVPLPFPMRAAPTITAAGSAASFAITAANGAANACTALNVTGSSTVPQPGGMIQVTCTPTSAIAVTVPSHLIGAATATAIKASAELS